MEIWGLENADSVKEKIADEYMPKQSLLKRVERIIVDSANDPELDIRARWKKVVDNGPGQIAVDTLGRPLPDADLNDVDLNEAINYAAEDASATRGIYPILSNEIDRMGLRKALEIDEAVVSMIVQMQQNGMLVDRDYLGVLNEIFIDTLFTVERQCHKLVGHPFTVTSPDQVAEVLFNELGLHGLKKTPTGKRYSTDEKTLDALEGKHPIIALLKEHREVSKLKGTYVDVLPTLLSPDGRIRMELGMTTIPSGRLNCWGGVNLLGIPVRTELGREIRRAFIAPEGRMLGAVDLNQIELRGLAVLSGDEHLLEAYYNGEDLHRNTAADAIYHIPRASVSFEQRQRGKVVNFAVANQISALGLRDQFYVSGITDVDEVDCQQMLDGWYERYSAVRPWYEQVYCEGRQNGYIRCPLSGRILWVPGLRSDIDKVRAQAERVATSFLMQTFAQVIGKVGMTQIWEHIKDDSQCSPLLYIHDELLVEIDEGIDYGDLLVCLMTETELAQAQPIPIQAAWHQGYNWKELK